ncbi:hypothetical protein O6H91_08G079800 [Diphasiastrum complanatum]|uniref:Uncharacterized protein n=1 Tax=Diphasiastrum complanatum TaxID=34168 RepID=A0ACC2CZH9_DIPCM|nr:hypothetical protein O6H91_08G079800 [Diphasiastrum complanatum]
MGKTKPQNGHKPDSSRGLKNIESFWLAPSPSKRWGELFFLAYSPRFGKLEYFVLGLIVALPCFLLPLIIVSKEDKSKPWYSRYWAKANVWIGIFGFVGNYFWTHYFYTVLGATYTFPSWRLNNVPLTTYFLTHAYFLFYHMISNMTLRRLRHAIHNIPSRVLRLFIQSAWIFILSYLTAFMEALTIANFPYYQIVNREVFYKVGSLFYAMYFLVSFPMFSRVDEMLSNEWTISQTSIDSLGAAMLVTILLDLWRILIGPIVTMPNTQTYKQCLAYGLPWLA